MPRTPIDYTKIIIYKIVCNDLTITELYIGSTINFTNRKRHHKYNCNTKNLKIYITINDNGGWDNWSMIEIERYPCLDGNSARKRERYWYDELNANLNTNKPSADPDYKQQYRILHRDEISKQAKQYYIENADKIKKQQAIYYGAHKEQKAIYYKLKKSQSILNADNSEPEIICESKTNSGCIIYQAECI